MTIFFHISPLDLNLVLLVSFIALLFAFACSATLLLHFDAVLVVGLPSQGSVCWGMNITIGMLILVLSLMLVMDLMCVLSCVDAVSLSDVGLAVSALRTTHL